MAAALGRGSRASLNHRVEPVLDPDGDGPRRARRRPARGGVRPGDARALMPVFAEHLALLVEKVEVQARRTASYEALVQIGMQIQAAEADVDADAAADRRPRARAARHRPRVDGARQRGRATLEMRVAVGARTEPFMRMRLALGDGVGGVVVDEPHAGRGARLRARAPADAAWVSDAILGEGIGSMLCCPMLTRREGRRRAVRRQPAAARVPADRGRADVRARRPGRGRDRERPALRGAGRAEPRARGLVRRPPRADRRGADRRRPRAHLRRARAAARRRGRARAGHLAAVSRALRPPARCPTGRRHDRHRRRGSRPPARCGLDALTPLQEKALEHAATVLALELVKERAQQQVEWQLQGDLLSELLDAGTPLAPSLVARARRHGVDLARAHRIVAVRCADLVADDLLELVRRATGRRLVHRDASLVCLRGEHVVLAARDAEPVVRAVTAAAERGPSRRDRRQRRVRRPRAPPTGRPSPAPGWRAARRRRRARRRGSARCASCSTRPTSRRSAPSSPSNSARCSPTRRPRRPARPRCARSSPPTATSPRPRRPASSTRTRCATGSSA